MSGITLDVGSAPLLKALATARARLRDMTPIYKAVGSAMERKVQMRFELKEDPEEQPWKAWAPSTAKDRAREGRGTLLEYTGRMRDSLTSNADAQGVEVGFGVDYAKHVDRTRPLLTVGGKLSASVEKSLIGTVGSAVARAMQASLGTPSSE